MTAKEKAKYIYDKFEYLACDHYGSNHSVKKECALICVDEMINFDESLFITEGSIAHKYLLDVKEEIKLL